MPLKGKAGEPERGISAAASDTVKFASARTDTVVVGLFSDQPAFGLETDDLIAETRTRAEKRLPRRDLWPALGLGLAFIGAAAPMALFLPSDRAPGSFTVILLVLTYALVSRIEFEVGAGCSVPSELVLVPMLFYLPIGSVPLAVAIGLLLGGLVDHVIGGRKIERAFGLLGSSWHAVGPALVLFLAGEPGLESMFWPVFLAALAAQFAFDFAASAIHDRLVRRISPRAELRLLAPVYATDAALAPVGLLAAAATQQLPFAFLLIVPLVWLLAVFARERRARIDHELELSHAYRGTALLLGDLIEADDAYTGSHSRDVVALVLEVSVELGLSPRERRQAELAALLHDVGKIRMPEEIINKPGPLTDDEWGVIETHTIEGERLLDQVGGLLAEIGHIVRSCHERWDGNGYPDRLAGEAIPVAARVVVTCDAFSAMTTTRSYRAALPAETAIAELRANAGTQFDPQAVEALVRVVARQREASGGRAPGAASARARALESLTLPAAVPASARGRREG
jgi:HD-GYP domain-containing protein (c-di-GMP phosphodiesterase class II)